MNILKNKKIAYVAFAPLHSLGVRKKVKNTCQALTNMGALSLIIINTSVSLKNVFRVIKMLRDFRPEYIVLRHAGTLCFILLPILLLYKIRGVKVILDIPTPLSIGLKETMATDFGVKSFISSLVLAIYTPFLNLTVDRILQYGPEGRWFSLGASNKTYLTANGYDPDSIKPQNKPLAFDLELKLIAVAAVAPWHGFDRIIQGLAIYNKLNKVSVKVSFTIVGEGPDTDNLKVLVKKLNLESSVDFRPTTATEKLNSLYLEHHIGIATLGGFRKGISAASDLKSREYACAGIPFLSAVNDLDFPEGLFFVHRIPNQNIPVDICSVIDFYKGVYREELPNEIRAYAVDTVPYEVKLRGMFDF